MPVLHVVIPFYNEGGTIGPILQRVLEAALPDGWSRALVVVDDHSTPADRQALDELAATLTSQGHRIRVCGHERNRGKGAALHTGFDAVLAAQSPDNDVVIIQDADLEYDPADYRGLIERLLEDDLDAVVGSRWDEHRIQTGLAHRLHALGNQTLTWCSNLMTGLDLRDMECCYKLLSVRMLRRLRPLLTEPRFGCEPQIVASLARLKARVGQTPVSYDPRSAAQGKKIGWKDGVRALWVIVRERFRPPDEDTKALFSPGKLLMQLAGFAVGAALLAWIIFGAIGEGDWSRLVHADPMLLAALLACTLVSAGLNGASFWVTVGPIRRIPFADMQRINLVANMLNYAPVRLGAIARVLYHVRVDGLSLLQIGAWFSLLGYVMVLGIASCVVATLVRFQVDWIWGLLVGAQMMLGILTIRVFSGVPLIVKHGRGLDRIIGDRGVMWSAAGLRIADLAAYTVRMAAAAAILDIELTLSQIVVLAIVALSASLIPFGRVGFREFCVAAVAHRLHMLGSDVDANMNQLALVESAGEALVFLPLGIVLLPWFRRRWRNSPVRS